MKNLSRAALVAAVLAACGEGGPTTLTPEQEALQQQIKARQSNWQDVGAAFKAVGDEVKAGRPTSTTATFSAQSVARYAAQAASWFPEGTGPASGLETDAKAIVWEESEDFAAALAEFQTASAALDEAMGGGDADAIAAHFQRTGATCKSCHDRFREDD